MNKQWVFDQVKDYFLDNIRNRGGQNGSGWTSCALGTITHAYCAYSNPRGHVEKVLGLPSYETWGSDRENFYAQIINFNDNYLKKSHPMTLQKLDQFLTYLAEKNGLNHESLFAVRESRIENSYVSEV